MKECRFCQDEIQDSETYKITEPDGKETFFCAECALNMIKHIESGDAEEAASGAIDWSIVEDSYTQRLNNSLWPSDLLSKPVIKPSSLMQVADDVPF